MPTVEVAGVASALGDVFQTVAPLFHSTRSEVPLDFSISMSDAVVGRLDSVTFRAVVANVWAVAPLSARIVVRLCRSVATGFAVPSALNRPKLFSRSAALLLSIRS